MKRTQVITQHLTNAKSSNNPDDRLNELGYALPKIVKPVGTFQLCRRTGNLIFTSGHLPQPANGDLMVGKVGKDLTVEEGAKAASYAALNVLATLKDELGSLNRIKRIVKVFGLVNCVDGFSQQPTVMNGFSKIFEEVFGDNGKHARSAVGTNALPFNIPVEVEVIVEFE